MNAYRVNFDEAKCMSFLMKDEGFLEKYNKIWKKVSNFIIKEFNSEPVYIEKISKTEKNLITKKSTQNNALDLFIYKYDSDWFSCIKDKNYYPQKNNKHAFRKERGHILLLTTEI